jgi:phosphatidylserine decarboxylase
LKQHITSAISQTFGRFASKEHGKTFQKMINRTYVRAMGLDMGEFDAPETYPTLNALFTRKFRQIRTFSTDPLDMISPCDSLITACGTIEEDLALQIKGMRYCVDGVLGDGISVSKKVSTTEYYHFALRVIITAIMSDMQVLHAVHIPGKLYPVNIPSLKKQMNLFIENERVVLECLSSDGKRFFLILVGALNVGEMEVNFEPRIRTNTTLTPSQYSYENLHLKKGDDFGCFHMGSTIVMLCENGMIDLALSSGENVKFAQTIARLKS